MILGILLWLALGGPLLAEVRPLAGGAEPLLTRSVGVARASSASLFSEGAHFLARAPPLSDGPVPFRAPQGEVALLLTLIARAEAGAAGHDAVQHGARIPPPRAPTAMTLGEIFGWIAATPGQPHAIGRYQFIPPTLRRVTAAAGIGPDVRFTPEVQDALALILLEEAGLTAFREGRLDRRGFMARLARIWAGLPLPDGRSHYHGYAGNRATMSWEAFEAGMARIWPTG
ncbi:MAG: hypothetical protein N4A39_00405 [Roseicyclus sp.]|nr:hypothetical protein [Roseicyclus sp.]